MIAYIFNENENNQFYSYFNQSVLIIPLLFIYFYKLVADSLLIKSTFLQDHRKITGNLNIIQYVSTNMSIYFNAEARSDLNMTNGFNFA